MVTIEEIQIVYYMMAATRAQMDKWILKLFLILILSKMVAKKFNGFDARRPFTKCESYYIGSCKIENPITCLECRRSILPQD
jgi:hypothetical protein